MMSPLSVSQFLDPDVLRFDCVIFDEASQICSEDAVSAIYRGKQVVICGDKMQLPPTSFFKQGDVDDDVASDEDVAVFESILAEAETAGFMPRQLTWHYRSAHESLIAFSNERFYNYSLVTFPSSASNAEETAVRFCHVSNGVYDRGGKRQNVVEADRVVQLVLEHIEKWPERSLGVVAFSTQQADAIQNRVELLQKQRRDLAWFFAEERLNGFFVKNLERVQGDERDHIMFSIGYGRDRNGSLTMNFGPVGKPGGEKRLNVAVTRARQQVTVVSSIRASDIDLDRVSSAGVLGLHKYLDFAERGYVALDQHGVLGDYESPFEEDVAGVIRSLGYSVFPQVGVSSFRIDLGVVDPADPGRFILGVECDGATYHSAYTARDRDRLRQEILERKMGWQLHRIWSPDWVQRRSSEISRLQAAIEGAHLAATTRDRAEATTEPLTAQDVHQVGASIAEEANAETSIHIIEPDQSGAQSWTEPYEVAVIRRAPLQCEFHEPRALGCLADMAMEVVSIEGPVHKAIVSSRLARRWNLERVGNRMVGAMESVFRTLSRRGNIDMVDGEFCTLRGASPRGKLRTPVPGRVETFRNIDHISTDEISLGVRSLLQEAISFEEDQLIVQLARVLGYDRTGSTIRSRLGETVDRLVDARQVAREGNRVVLLV